MDKANNIIPLGCIIMASGAGKRFGSNKLLANFNGKPLIENILNTIMQMNFAKTAVITRSEEIESLCSAKQLNCVLHNYPGQNDTARLGMKAAYSPELSGYIFCVGDQPLLSQQTLHNLCQAFLQNPQYIYRTIHNDKPGNPVIFPKKYAAELMQLPQDKGGSYLTKKYPEQVRFIPVQDAYELYDIDTAEDLQHLEILLTSSQQAEQYLK